MGGSASRRSPIPFCPAQSRAREALSLAIEVDLTRKDMQRFRLCIPSPFQHDGKAGKIRFRKCLPAGKSATAK